MLLIYQFIFMKICLPHWKNNRPIEKSSLHGLLTFSAWPSHDLGGLTVSTVTRGQGQYFRHGICGFITGFPGPWFVFTFKFSCKRIVTCYNKIIIIVFNNKKVQSIIIYTAWGQTSELPLRYNCFIMYLKLTS